MAAAAAATWGSALLGLVPSELKIGKAIRSLLKSANLWQSASSFVLESILLSIRLGSIRHALHLLQMEPVIKGLVISLVLDKAFWSAIMNNQSVKKFLELLLSEGIWNRRKSYFVAVLRCLVVYEINESYKTESPQICEEVDCGTNNLQLILDILWDKIVELVEKFKLLLIKILQLSQLPTPEATVDGSS